MDWQDPRPGGLLSVFLLTAEASPGVLALTLPHPPPAALPCPDPRL